MTSRADVDPFDEDVDEVEAACLLLVVEDEATDVALAADEEFALELAPCAVMVL